jgi:hypothetical protein
MTNRVFLALACVLLAVRLPSLVQPMGADQGLYAYIGDRILAGGLPYRDAWDQKPPAVHLAYAAMRAPWPHDSAVPAADLLLAAVVALLLREVGAALATRLTGQLAALLFLLLANPAFARLGGVAVRAQCETFIAAAVTGAFLLLVRGPGTPGLGQMLAAGFLFGVAFAFKYNAAVYVVAGVFALFLRKRLTVRALAALAIGFVLPAATLAGWLAAGGALADLHDATVAYNLQYSGETYAGPLHMAAYLLTFPIRHARTDALWLVGGGGCAVLLFAWSRARNGLIVVAWVAAACLTIAINGSRELPQYFVQAGPPLALAGAWAGAILWNRRRVVNAAAAVALTIAVWRVNDFPKLAASTRHDARYALGQIDRREHLEAYGDRTARKYSALAIAELGQFMGARSSPQETVYVFGFSCAAYVHAGRRSASRFFWSRPVIVGFNERRPGYGVGGLLDDLNLNAPAIVALQQRDWVPDVDNSSHFFMNTPSLAGWLQRGYERVDGPDGFDVWLKRVPAQ